MELKLSDIEISASREKISASHEKRDPKDPAHREPTLPPEPRNPDELDSNGRPPHHPGAIGIPGEGPNPTPPVTR